MKAKLVYTLIIFLIGGFLIFKTLVLSKPIVAVKTFANSGSKLNIPTHAFMGDYKKSGVCVKDKDIKIYVYMFHYVIPDKFVDKKNKGEYNNSMSPAIFESYMRKINSERTKGNIDIISMNDLIKARETNCFSNKNLVILTSDDGWDDSYNFLFPLAKKYKIPFNLAIISSKVSKINAEINNFANEKEIKEMLDSGLISLSSHTVNHFDLRRLDEQKREVEICDSKKTLESMFDTKINSLVYPSGKYDEETLKLMKKCGYKFGFTILNKHFTPIDLKNRPYELTRIRVNRDSGTKIFDFSR